MPGKDAGETPGEDTFVECLEMSRKYPLAMLQAESINPIAQAGYGGTQSDAT